MSHHRDGEGVSVTTGEGLAESLRGAEHHVPPTRGTARPAMSPSAAEYGFATLPEKADPAAPTARLGRRYARQR
ncbi:hypothetical protein [Streptomyces sp. WAC00263]|uniref:hypothetical protein n=1 Tax=Streptomyces sp. WAC00263 TaxID=1917422 RepID=UPI0015EECD78|nr:hypothetical protein [Streptomyces sp. WAC00263]KAF5993136.1 hypothetical protein BOG92_016125 [Streptomyces sp. WAC00263]